MLNNNYNLLGVMQGRLLKKYRDRYQAHPINYWQDEFQIAKKLRLQCIEFIFDYNDYNLNPLMSSQGIQEIKKYTHDTSVLVKTICADYFMEAPLHTSDKELTKNSINILKKLIVNSSKLNITDIIIPCVDRASIKNNIDYENFIDSIKRVAQEIDEYDVNLTLETDLSPDNFYKLITKINSNKVKVNYDIGNSASLGYDLKEELHAYGNYITDIHIKDRLLGGGSVILGEGSSNFGLFFDELSKYNYSGPFIMQAYRDEDGISIFKKQLKFINQFL